MSQVEQQGQALEQSQKAFHHSEQVNRKLTYELALLKRHKFGQRSEQLNALQASEPTSGPMPPRLTPT